MFDINEKPKLLDKGRSDMFHNMTAKLLFLAQRGRPDIHGAIAFLTTRVKCADDDDYKKLGRVIRYLRDTKDLVMTLEADNTYIIKQWVHASFVVHQDLRSHTGGTMTMGKESVYSTSTRQKLNTNSLTEAKLLGVDDVMPMIVWTKYFLESQGYEIQDSKMYQDNQSAISLNKYGKASNRKRTRHIDIRYFFITDRVRAKQVSINYCPTGDSS